MFRYGTKDSYHQDWIMIFDAGRFLPARYGLGLIVLWEEEIREPIARLNNWALKVCNLYSVSP